MKVTLLACSYLGGRSAEKRTAFVFVFLLIALKPQEWLLLIDYSDEHANTEIRRLSPPRLKPQTTPVAGEGGREVL